MLRSEYGSTRRPESLEDYHIPVSGRDAQGGKGALDASKSPLRWWDPGSASGIISKGKELKAFIKPLGYQKIGPGSPKSQHQRPTSSSASSTAIRVSKNAQKDPGGMDYVQRFSSRS